MSVLLNLYKNIFSPFLSALTRTLGLQPQCKFHPTCSEYAAGAIALHGPIRGSVLAAARLCRCHPWNRGGVDPVPFANKPQSSSLAR